jgi:tRNA nucleotidyltransferase (CCA-adding enzyme)
MLRNTHIKICEAIRDAGGKPYVVGGWVRDLIIGRPSHDVDICVVGFDSDTANTVLNRQLGGKLVGESFPVYIVDGVEVALARTERKVGNGHAGFEVEIKDVTLKEDLQRRDLTINAMAMDPFTNEIIDPFGGRMDIQNNVLRVVGPHFMEDPLRILRVARFAAQFSFGENRGGILSPSIDEGVVVLAKRVLHELPLLAGERVMEELMKALRSNHPSVFFGTLNQLGALEILFPEIAALQGRVQPEKYHPEGDAYFHTLLVVDRARELGADDETMFASLVHDLGKAVTPDDNLPHHYNHESLGVPLVHEMCDRLKVPNTFRKIAALAAKHHLNVHRFEELKAMKKVRLLKALGDENTIRQVALASQADAQGRGPDFREKPYPQRERISEAFAIIRSVRGHQFAHLKDGRVIAQKMEEARAKALKQAGF